MKEVLKNDSYQLMLVGVFVFCSDVFCDAIICKNIVKIFTGLPILGLMIRFIISSGFMRRHVLFTTTPSSMML